jgi:bifunctional DNA-binding transcriptional regulator/antitoxin component of YhaV-PrlF toxin-antitoxin module
VASTLDRKHVTQVYVSGSGCTTITIPKPIAERFGLTRGTHVIVEPIERGVLVRNIEDRLI